MLSICLGLPPFRVLAQNPRGSLRGIVQDFSGAGVPGAKIVVKAADSSLQREASSDSQGEFRLDDLLPGTYQAVVSAAGFAAASADVKVVISSVQEIRVTLKPQAVQQTVNVQGQASSITTQLIDTASAVHQTIITSQDLNTIPLAARSFANIAYLAPGTEPLEPSDPTKARITAVSTGGSSGLNNDLSVDGGDNSDDWIGGFLQNYSPEAIQEFAVATAQESADIGRTTAAAVVITTKRGTNDWHGDESFYERDASLNARFPIDNPAPNPKQPFSRQNYVGTLGGPVIRDKVWVFGSLEYVHENASIAYSQNSLTEFNALSQLAQQGLITVNTANGPSTVTSIPVPSSVPIPFRDYLGLIRFDWAQSARSNWFLRGSFDTYTTHNALIQQATLASTGATTHNNYLDVVLSNQFTFSPSWVGSFLFSGSGLHLTQSRNSNLGFALAFPFSTTTSTISGSETFGDQQFVTPITAFPVLRNQEKYQFRHDVSHAAGKHAARFGVNFIHEPVLSGALTANAETVVTFPEDPSFYLTNQAQFTTDLAAGSSATPDSDGSFSQSIRRLGLYAEDSWRATRRLTINYGLRYDTTYGLFIASGQNQNVNPALAGNGIITGIPHDYRKAFAPRLGVAYSLDDSGKTVLRGGVGLYYADLAQNGWVEALTAVNQGNLANGTSPPSLIDPNYTTPYALHATGGVQHAFNSDWTLSADYTLETGMHGYRRYDYPNVSVFRTDNRSSYKALMLHLQGNAAKRLSLVANYTLASAKTWGCQIGELFDYVNGVCDALNPFAPGDYGPSGEDVRHRGVVAGTVHVPAGFDVTLLFQAESARPITLTTPATGNRAVINGVESSLDQFRGTPYVQMDMRVTRPFKINERVAVSPFVEFFNLFNRSNPGNNYIPDVSAIPTPVNDTANVTSVCLNPPACTQNRAVTSGNQLLFQAGALGDFFGPGTTVGIPFAAQVGVRLTF
ncbi:MAG TPA: carboxypeptidase regulatory-like domain-containing protein [Candidatus Acidoferrum sp.]|nr:carboxypeptidase regulatory-like domain-containing protein [Candidatus Acidoferrum sp.]